MKKQFYPLLSYLAIAAFLLGIQISASSQVSVTKAKSTLNCNTPPSISCPPDYNACPGSSIDPAVSHSAVAFPGGPECGVPVVAFKDNLLKTGNCAGSKLIQRIWTAQDPDDSNLRAFCIQYLSTLDTTAPVFSNCPRDTSILSNSNCITQFKWIMPSVTDVCGNFSVVTSVPNGSDFTVGHHTIVITATDVCGNSSSCSFNLEVISNCCSTPPVITCPPYFTACPGTSTDPSVTGRPVVQKSSPQCKEPIITFTDKFLQNFNCTLELERTWTATDPDNHLILSNCIQKIKMQDTIPPMFTSKAANITVNSDDNCIAVVTWNPFVAVDNCGGPVTMTSTVPSGWQFTIGTSAVAIIATDACGNTNKCEFLVTVVENCCNKPPVLNCPSDYVGCPGSSLDPNITGIATATPESQKCKTPIVHFSDQFIKTTDCETELIRTWKATDPDNGSLISTCNQKIKLEDKTAPVFTSCPNDITVQSGSECTAIVNWNAPVVTDNCSHVNVISSITSGSTFVPGNTTVIITATDACGNSSTCNFVVTVIENCCKVPPVIHCPADFNGCPSVDLDPQSTGLATASPGDVNCEQPILSYVDKPIKYISCLLELERTWTATDPSHSSLTSSCIQKITLKDDEAPVITSCPANVTVQSNANCTAIVNWNPPTATDNCGSPVITTSLPTGFEFQVGTTGVVVIATDACGNTSKCEFLVTVEANCCQSPPVINCPADYIGCPSSDLSPDVTGKATALPANSFCDIPFLSYHDDLIQTTTCLTEIKRTWTATDAHISTLQSSCIQTIILKDDESPVFTFCPANITVQSNDTCVAFINWNPPLASDNCSAPIITTSIPSGSEFQIGVTNVIVTATDACGNSASCEFNIRVEENCCNKPPVVTCPPDYRACPGSSTDISETGFILVDPYQPVCQFALISFTDTIVSTDSCRFTIQRNWSAVNPKNNAESDCVQFITLLDTIEPEFAACPTDITIDPQPDCTASVDWTSPFATDNCGISSLVSTHQPGSIFSKGVTKVVYTATDNCGNTSSCWFYVTVTDKCCDKNPVIHCPTYYTACPGSAIVPDATGLATADPGTPSCQQPFVTYADRTLRTGPCPGAIKLERTWSAKDPLANTLHSECIQIIDIKDTIAPTLKNLPNDITVNAKGACDVPMFWKAPVAVDNCGMSGLYYNYQPGAHFSAGTTNIVYTAVDLCGLSTKDSFKITVTGTDIGIICPDDTTVVRTDPFVNGAFVDWTTPQVKHCSPCTDNLPGFIYMGELNGHRYFCSTGTANWNGARTICEQMGGELAVINSEKENKFLASKLMGLTAWVGGTDQRQEGHFEWIDNSPFNYFNWLPGQPNNANGNENYIELLPDGTWNDQNGDATREFICEMTCYDLTQIGGAPQGSLLPCGMNKITYVAQKDGKTDTCSFSINVDCDKESIYCKAKAQDSKYMYINKVQFAGIDTTTGDNGGYIYFNKVCGAITQGQTYPICVTPGFLTSTYTVYWKIWIDFNADGFFDPVTEEVVYGFGTTTMCAVLTMPPSLPSKQTRMRVIMSFSGYPTSPCTSPLFGEVEDYCILMNGASPLRSENIITPKSFVPVQLHCSGNCEENNKSIGDPGSFFQLDLREADKYIFDADLFPNPSTNKVTVVSKKEDLAEYEIYDHHGKMVLRSLDSKIRNEFSFSVRDWQNGIYSIIINNNSGEQLIKRFMVNH